MTKLFSVIVFSLAATAAFTTTATEANADFACEKVVKDGIGGIVQLPSLTAQNVTGPTQEAAASACENELLDQSCIQCPAGTGPVLVGEDGTCNPLPNSNPFSNSLWSCNCSATRAECAAVY